jgi:hypothetical protein
MSLELIMFLVFLIKIYKFQGIWPDKGLILRKFLCFLIRLEQGSCVKSCFVQVLKLACLGIEERPEEISGGKPQKI